MTEVILLRHGQTEWSLSGRHTGRTDVPLTDHGRKQAAELAPLLVRREFGQVLTSPASRARETACLAGLDDARVCGELWEWDYGGYEGLSTAAIRRQRPDWFLWRDGIVPGDADHPGESIDQVGARADAVLEEIRPTLANADVALVAHGHVLRVLTARWLGLEPAAGRYFRLATGTVSALGFEHETPVIDSWNIPPHLG